MTESSFPAMPRRVMDIPETRHLRGLSSSKGEAISLPAASEMIGLNRDTLSMYVRRGEAVPFPIFRKGTVSYARLADVMDYIQRNKTLIARRHQAHKNGLDGRSASLRHIKA